MEFVHGMNEIVLYFQNAMPLLYLVKRSKIIKITITKLNKLKLELKSLKKWNKIRITKFKKIVLKLQLKILKLQKHCIKHFHEILTGSPLAGALI